jgi:hypothetical protein
MVRNGIYGHSNKKTKDWFTNYVKDTKWIGCKMPVVRQVVNEVYDKNSSSTTTTLLDTAVELLQQDECDVKIAGMILLSEKFPKNELATLKTLERLEDAVLFQNHLADWSSTDWFCTKVLKHIVFSGNHTLSNHVLEYTNKKDTPGYNYVYVRRCGVVPFLQYDKQDPTKLPQNFGVQLIDACERSLQTSPHERFKQTGIACWKKNGRRTDRAKIASTATAAIHHLLR